MAAKLLHSLADDNPDLQKQIGCMTGIFQVFDRQHMGRRLNTHTQKRLLPPANTHFSNGRLDADSNNAYSQGTMERNKCANDKREPADASNASLSPLDCGKVGHLDPSSLDRISFPENPSSDKVLMRPSASPKLGRLSLDLREVVKDSMYRDSRGLSNQPIMTEEGSKTRNSPRPLQLSENFDGSLGIGKNDFPGDLKESLNLLAKLREAPWYYSENEQTRLSFETKDRSDLAILRDAPRYSFDGRDSKNYCSSESRDFSKLNQRIKDLPRLSLDGRESSMQASSYDLNLAYLSNDTDNRYGRLNDRVSYAQQSSRPPSVVAKLMGLEILPDDTFSRDTRLGPSKATSIEGHGSFPMSLKTSPVCKPIRLPSSPKNLRKEPNSPQWKHADMRPIPSSRCPIEPAPWKHLEGDRSSQKQVVKQLRSPEKVSKSSTSVYCEIEKRLKDLEFKQSGKDLRALKQIMEAMQAKGLLGTEKVEQGSILGKEEEKQSCKGSKPNSGFISASSHRTRVGASCADGANSSKAYESSIVIMKPAKLVQQSGIPASSLIPVDALPALRSQESDITRQGKYSVSRRAAKNQSSKSSDRIGSNRPLRTGQNSARTEQASRDNILSSSKNSGATSPRLQKKLELDTKSRPHAPNSCKSRRQSNRQATESGGSAGGKHGLKSAIVLQTDDQLTERSSELVETSEHTPTTEALKCTSISEIKMSSSIRWSEDDLVVELPNVAPEHPSPVSVLDASAYREDSPSPVKQTSQHLEGIMSKTVEHDPGVGERNFIVNPSTDDDIGSDFTSEINTKKLRNIDNLIHKLRQLNSNHDEVHTDYIASLCENSNPDHRYVSEILLASGLLLRDLGSASSTFHHHLSGHTINPELFLVLEQTNLSSLLCKPESEKLHRKLVFDVTNEILAGKLGPPADPLLKPCKLARKKLNAQKLLKELCSEIDQLHGSIREEFSSEEEQDGVKSILWKDVMHRSLCWTEFDTDISGVVLDVERSIFKDLVNEIVTGEASGLRGNPRRQRRQLLFFK